MKLLELSINRVYISTHENLTKALYTDMTLLKKGIGQRASQQDLNTTIKSGIK